MSFGVRLADHASHIEAHIIPNTTVDDINPALPMIRAIPSFP